MRNSNGIKRYKEFCSLHGLEELIQEPTRITEKSETLLGRIISNSAQKFFQHGLLNLGLSNDLLYKEKVLDPRVVIKNTSKSAQ